MTGPTTLKPKWGKKPLLTSPTYRTLKWGKKPLLTRPAWARGRKSQLQLNFSAQKSAKETLLSLLFKLLDLMIAQTKVHFSLLKIVLCNHENRNSEPSRRTRHNIPCVRTSSRETSQNHSLHMKTSKSHLHDKRCSAKLFYFDESIQKPTAYLKTWQLGLKQRAWERRIHPAVRKPN